MMNVTLLPPRARPHLLVHAALLDLHPCGDGRRRAPIGLLGPSGRLHSCRRRVLLCSGTAPEVPDVLHGVRHALATRVCNENKNGES